MSESICVTTDNLISTYSFNKCWLVTDHQTYIKIILYEKIEDQLHTETVITEYNQRNFNIWMEIYNG